LAQLQSEQRYQQLKVYWTGASMAPGVPTNADTFPDAGPQPSDISTGANFYKAGVDGLFDIRLEWKDGANKLGSANPDQSFSKLLLVYDDGKTNIDASDFFFGSAPAKGSKFGPFKAGAHIRNIPVDGEERGWIAAVPEPQTYAMLGIGLVAVAMAARRKGS
jgi:hypothetical protein